MGLLIPEVFVILLTDLTASLLLVYLVPTAYRICTSWDIESPSAKQYKLEQKRILAAVIVKFIFLLKIPMFLFYIYANDKMAAVLTGAMCAAGSVNATQYGAPLLYIKIAVIFLMVCWLTLSMCSSNSEKLPFTRLTYGLLLATTTAVSAETLLSFLNFVSIDPTAVVSCCSSLYSQAENSGVLLSLEPFTAFFIFAVSASAYLTALLTKKHSTAALLFAVFFVTAIINMILFTGTYIYELPSHKCPFCLLQKEYYYVGYIFYISLFLSVSGGLSSFIHNRLTGRVPHLLERYTLIFTIIYILMSVFYPLKYYVLNGQWL